MAQMDLAAGNAAARRARGRCATVRVQEINFLAPVHVGDEQVKVTDALFTFVALDTGGRPRPVPAA